MKHTLQLLLALLATATASAQVPSLINYQGRISVGGTNFEGTGQFKFALVNTAGTVNYWANDGTASGAPTAAVSLTVTKGLYSVLLGDTTVGGMTVAIPASVFANTDVRLRVYFNDGVSGFQQLTPDQRIAAVGYALVASTVQDGAITSVKLAAGSVTSTAIGSGSVTSTHLAANSVGSAAILAGAVGSSQLAANSVTATAINANAVTTAKLAANAVGSGQLANAAVGSAQLDLTALTTALWKAAGNAGTTPGTHFLGTTDNQALEFKVNNLRVLRIEPTSSNAPNIVLGATPNFVASGVVGAVIAGGGAGNFGGSAVTNLVQSNFGVIGGGGANGIKTGSIGATIAGGYLNLITNATYAFVGGGYANAALTNSATVAGGYYNAASGFESTVAGGEGNVASGTGSFIGGGVTNIASGFEAVVAGGELNDATGAISFVGGGYFNGATNYGATVGGGYANAAGGTNSTVGGGEQNIASGSVSSVGGGYFNGATGFASTIPGGYANAATGSNSFAAGYFAAATNHGTFVWSDNSSTNIFYSSANNQFSVRSSGGARFISNAAGTTGTSLAAGGGSFISLSDRNAKENFAPVDPRLVLEKVAAMPLTTWNYKSQAASIRHIGPMAQDFHAAFAVGESNLGITGTDADGVALAAIQGLNAVVKEKDARITDLERRLADLEAKVQKLVK